MPISLRQLAVFALLLGADRMARLVELAEGLKATFANIARGANAGAAFT
ncbi:hypothetical protein [Bradyrhizobium sp. McL0616]